MSLISSADQSECFEALYRDSYRRLTRQTYLLVGHRHRAAHCVRRAFQLAWKEWDAVSADSSPEGWIRAAAFDLALSPWHRNPLRHPAAADQLTRDDRTLLTALLHLPRAQRRAVVLHDALGLDWAQTAAEVESSTPAAYGRVVRARLGLARMAPAVAGTDARRRGFGRELGVLLRGAAVRGCPLPPVPSPGLVRQRSRLHERGVTAAAGVLTLGMAGALAAGAMVGTPWHPPTIPFIAYHSANRVAADSVQGALTGPGQERAPAVQDMPAPDPAPRTAPGPAPALAPAPVPATAVLPDLSLFTAATARTGQLPARLTAAPPSGYGAPARPLAEGLLLPPPPAGPAAADRAAAHSAAHRSMHRPSLPNTLCRLFALPCHRHH
ncbi:RNA polymerase sigma factor [Streptacidiphilus carbonis]|uniref:RNA polymerase sigma factor n=1 Tax=Streptacidiphilus carbonis TaxID=105422 RepID=UPI00069370C0|nr:sigma factor-like helix-turn-helix DNA-binding protein [Streptacidiphilus carbonis]